MTNDPEELFENLAKKCPELMERSNIGDYIGVDSGWFTIIYGLCVSIYSPVQQAKYRLKAARDYPREDEGEYLIKCEKDLANSIEELPIIAQIKEKFGTLRFYCYNSNDRVSALVDFAELLSGMTCEKCGAPGTQDTVGWIKTYCKIHQRKDPDENQLDIEDGALPAKIEDDDPASW